MRMKDVFKIGALGTAMAVSACATPAQQQDAQTAYVVAATAGDVTIISGKANPDLVGQICLGDNAAYKILLVTRHTTDVAVDYSAADLAHVTLQTDGSRVSGQCIVPPPAA